MSLAADAAPIVGINWGSSNFRAYLIDAAGGAIDEFAEPKGVVGMDRAAMAAMIDALAARWPGIAAVYACGMIGSNVGWTEVPYAETPAGAAELAAKAVATTIGGTAVTIVPGITCQRSFDGQPDILRGEEIELLGLAATGLGDGLAVLPGTHTKWAWRKDGRVTDFFTSMSGEIFDRLTAQGLLASIVEGEARDGAPFLDGVAIGMSGYLSLGTALFGARAKVIRGQLAKADAASYLRGLLIGSEVADARRAYPALGDATLPLVGNTALSALYASALDSIGIASERVESRTACLAGFRALHDARSGG